MIARPPIWVNAERVADMGIAAACEAIEAGFARSIQTPERIVIRNDACQLMLMPATTSESIGAKVLTIAQPERPIGFPRVQGVYVLFDGQTGALVAMLDGEALTLLRTPAVSLVALRAALRSRPAPVRVAVIGSGPQALAHAHGVRVVLRDAPGVERVDLLVRSPSEPDADEVDSKRVMGTKSALQTLAAADAVICATNSPVPLFDSSLLRTDAVVIAIGSHEAHMREVDSAFVARAAVYVEHVSTAVHESGDIVLPIEEGVLDPTGLQPITTLLDRSSAALGAVLVKTTGSAWQDLVIAEALARADRGLGYQSNVASRLP